ncbi:siderophore ferric iron reductase [Nostoc sp. 3335mG]|nr:siderophore ferric iron reductase [Nostoc sp. 3335mG]
MAARNFLFGLDSHDVALTRLLETAARVTGFMQGAPGAPLPGWHVPGADNHAILRDLRARIAATHPSAGEPYYAVQLWTTLIWQPAYLAVIAVHVHGALPDIRAMSQKVRDTAVSGFRLPPGPQQRAATEAMIAQAGQSLRAMTDAMLVEVNAVSRLKRLPALRLLADRMLGLMVRLRDYCPGITLDAQERFCALWLEAMGLRGQGHLDRLDLADGRQVLVIARKGCCLDYRAFPGTYCSSCPKQDDAVRIGRQRDEAVAELDG